MAEEHALEQAREAVSQILEVLGIARVVCVDDEYKDTPSIEDAVAAGNELTPEQVRAALPEVGEANLDDLDVRNELIRRALDGLEANAKQERCERLLAVARIKTGDGTDDKADASVLEQLVPRASLIPLTAKRWRNEAETFLAQDSEQRALFLFDQDLSQDEGEPTEGMKIISAVLANDPTGSRICGLLTHTVTPETEEAQWKELSRSFGVPADRFIVVPKKWLSQDPLVFAQRLKLAALSPDFSKLKKKAAEIVQRAAAAATSEVDEISIFDLEHIVFKVAGTEGLWEPDMIFRLHALFSRLEARRLAHQAGELESIAKRLRSVSHIPTDSASLPPLATWTIQRRELYEAAEYLNANNMPLELGDIFEKTDSESKKAYILLAQPCDLMVRPRGRREPEAEYLPLVEITLNAEAPKHAEELEYFGEGPSKRYFVRLKQVHQVKACALDLCVFNADGNASIELEKECPDSVRPAWKRRYGHLMEIYQKKAKRLQVMWPAREDTVEARRAKEAIQKMVLSDLLSTGPFRGNVAESGGRKTVQFNFRRIGHLARERAFGLLMAYTSCLGRPGYDRDFGKPLNPPID